MEKMKSIVFGIDPGLNNPAATKINPLNKTVTFYYFQNRQKDTMNIKYCSNSKWTFIPSCLGKLFDEGIPIVYSNTHTKVSERFGKYYKNVIKLLSVIPPNSNVIIEHYPLHIRKSSSMSVMIEIGAYIRMLLITRNCRLIEIPPSQIKKQFTGNGKSSKEEMYIKYKSLNYPSLYKLLGMDKTKYKKVPHPIEDIVDSFAIALCFFNCS